MPPWVIVRGTQQASCWITLSGCFLTKCPRVSHVARDSLMPLPGASWRNHFNHASSSQGPRWELTVLPSRGTWQHLETVLVLILWGGEGGGRGAPACGLPRPGVLPNLPRCAGRPVIQPEWPSGRGWGTGLSHSFHCWTGLKKLSDSAKTTPQNRSPVTMRERERARIGKSSLNVSSNTHFLTSDKWADVSWETEGILHPTPPLFGIT